MRSRRWRLWGVTVLGGFLALGCEKALVKPDYPPDPVLVSKRPVEGQVTTSHPVVVRHEPVVPPLPETAIASAPSTLSSSARTTTAKPLYPAPEQPPQRTPGAQRQPPLGHRSRSALRPPRPEARQHPHTGRPEEPRAL